VASGMTPLAIMIANARWAHAQATQLTEELAQAEPSQSAELFREMMHFRQLAVEWAHMAAPHVHPRLAAVAHGYTNQTAVRLAQGSMSSYMALRLKLRVLPKQCQAFLRSGTEVVFEQYLVGRV
jgi:hypothetical protein